MPWQGCNMNRPGLQELLKDVNAGKIDVVVVYKLDRISRSLRDFTELDGIFSRHGASMVSVTQQIDTSTSMGRMILNLLMSFAQFEREMTSDRVRDKMAASRKKGIWTGGVIPYGYKSIDSKLVPDPENAPIIVCLRARGRTIGRGGVLAPRPTRRPSLQKRRSAASDAL